MKKFKFSLYKPVPALILYVLYILALEVLQLYIDDSLGYAIMIWLGSVFYGYLIAYSFKSIFRASQNKISTGMAVVNISIAAISGVIFFAINYFFIYQLSNTHFAGNLGDNPIEIFISFLYFSCVTFATVGFGDISASSSFARILVMAEVIYSFFIIVIAFSGFSQLKESLRNSNKEKK